MPKQAGNSPASWVQNPLGCAPQFAALLFPTNT